MHKVTVTFATSDNNALNEIIRLALSLKYLVHEKAEVSYDVGLDNSLFPEPVKPDPSDLRSSGYNDDLNDPEPF